MTAKERWIIIIGRSITENSSSTKPLQPSTNSNRTALDRESDTLLAVQELETQNQQQQQQHQQQIGPFVKMGWAVGAGGERGVIKRHPLLGAWPVPHPFPDAVSLIFVFLSFFFKCCCGTHDSTPAYNQEKHGIGAANSLQFFDCLLPDNAHSLDALSPTAIIKVWHME